MVCIEQNPGVKLNIELVDSQEDLASSTQTRPKLKFGKTIGKFYRNRYGSQKRNWIYGLQEPGDWSWIWFLFPKTREKNASWNARWYDTDDRGQIPKPGSPFPWRLYRRRTWSCQPLSVENNWPGRRTSLNTNRWNTESSGRRLIIIVTLGPGPSH